MPIAIFISARPSGQVRAHPFVNVSGHRERAVRHFAANFTISRLRPIHGRVYWK